MHELVKQLLSENDDRKEKADELIINSASLLKLIAVILRSYPQASLIFVHMSYKGDSVMKQIIRNFLLNNADPKNAEMDAAAKAVLSCLMTSLATSKVTDQIVDDLKLLLCSITEEYANGKCNAATTIEKTKIGIKFADQLTIIARLLIVFKETVTHQVCATILVSGI
jgi:23S rRNA maturation mini-RNase III